MKNREAPQSPSPMDLKFVGPATAAVLEEAPFDADALRDGRVSYEMLLDAGVNPGVAGRIRREHSLPWSFAAVGGPDLARRAAQVGGLREEERAWIAASSGEGAPVSSGSSSEGASPQVAERVWQDRSRPTPVTELPGINSEQAKALAEAGITSVRSLAVSDPEQVADALEIDRAQVTEWRDAARERR